MRDVQGKLERSRDTVKEQEKNIQVNKRFLCKSYR